MLLKLVNQEWEAVWIQLWAMFICWFIVLLAVAIDFYFGVQKSKERGKPYIHSYGIKKSGKKLSQYLAVMAFMAFMDVINPLWIYLDMVAVPIFTIAGCAIWVWTERKSVLEKFEDKVKHDFEDNAKDLMKTLKDISSEVKELTADVADIKDNSRRLKNENTPNIN